MSGWELPTIVPSASFLRPSSPWSLSSTLPSMHPCQLRQGLFSVPNGLDLRPSTIQISPCPPISPKVLDALASPFGAQEMARALSSCQDGHWSFRATSRWASSSSWKPRTLLIDHHVQPGPDLSLPSPSLEVCALSYDKNLPKGYFEDKKTAYT